jgi:hypothetical protein
LFWLVVGMTGQEIDSGTGRIGTDGIEGTKLRDDEWVVWKDGYCIMRRVK